MVDLAVPLAPFLRRPPTPPRESTSKLSEENDFPVNLASNKSLDTPEESPSSSAEYFRNSCGRVKKKVVISAWKQYHQPPSDSSRGYDSDDLRPLPPSRECKPAASILKHSSELSALDGRNDPVVFDTSNLQAMLRSATLHLTGDSRASRLDAYNSLLACLSAYEDIPDAHQLSAKVTEILGCIRRDVTSNRMEGASVDIQIATQALKLVTVFLCTPSLIDQVSEEFRHFIIDQSIASLGDEKAPKILVSHYMHLLEKQKFGHKFMSTERATRLLSALDSITTRVKGTRIAGHRLMIYQRLLSQAKSVMAFRPESWINHLISGLLCSTRDIRIRAINFGNEAGLQLGSSTSVSQAFLMMLNHQSPDGRKVFELLCVRMQEMAASKEDGQHVPQMWSVVILFLRSRRRQIECWDHIKAWLDVLEKCFNSSDAQIKFQANIAWNRLIFGVNIDTSTSSSMAKMLKAPIVVQLERKQNEKVAEKNIKLVKQVARSSYCTLLYYALRPSASYAQLDQYWDLYVANILPHSFTKTRTDLNYACEILAALLFNDGQPRLWNNNKANMMGPTTYKDLPCLDPKWIRSRVSKVMDVFEKIFDLAEWAGTGERSAPVVMAWRCFMAALGSAGSKEIKVSSEIMIAIAEIVNQVRCLLNRASGEQSDAAFYERIGIIFHEATSKIGALAFNEKRLILTAQSAFEAVPETPPSRSKNNPASPSSAAIHLIRLLRQKPVSHEHTAYKDTATKIIQVALESAHTRHGKLSVLRNIARLCAPEGDTVPSQSRLVLWQVIADVGISMLQFQRASESHDRSPQPPGHEYRDAVKILEIAIQYQSVDIFPVWQRLFDRLVETLRLEIGPAAVTLVSVEPLAGLVYGELAQKLNDFSIDAAVKITERVCWVRDRHSLERTHLQLWGAIPGYHKSLTLDLPEDMYALMNISLEQGYSAVSSLPAETISSLLSAVTSVIQSCPSDFKTKLLMKLQNGIALWVEDLEGSLPGSDKVILSKAKNLWALVVTLVESLHDFSSQVLFDLQVLITASLKSRHKPILSGAILLWNRTFGCAETLEYPDNLSKALLKLKSIADINLPGFTDQAIQEESSPFRFVESQDADELETGTALFSRRLSPGLRLPSSGTPLEKRSSIHSPSPSPLPSARRKAKRMPKARLRHDDSQTHFAAIESLPLPSKDGNKHMLTERQREVNERQKDEAALFPEVRSLQREASMTKDQGLPKLDLKSKQALKVSHNSDEDTSPTFPPDNMMDGFLGSSPTPSSSRHRSRERFFDGEPASSPPLISTDFKLPQPKSLSPAPESRSLQVLHEEPSLPTPQEHFQDKAATFLMGSPSPCPMPPKNREDQPPQSNIFSDQDVFVDAPSEPQIRSDEEYRNGIQAEGQSLNDVMRTAETAASAIAIAQPEGVSQGNPSNSIEGEPHKIMSSFQSETSLRLSADDDEAAAQLLAEMENAHSQAPQRKSQRILRRDSKKRKVATDRTSKKRRKTSQVSHASSGATNDFSPSAVVADCVLIESRPAIGTFQSSPSQVLIKRERSESPGAGAFLSTVEPMTTPERARSDRQTPTARSEAARQNSSSNRRSGRKTLVKNKPDEKSEEVRMRPGGKTRGSTRMGEDARESPLSSDPLHGDNDILASSVSLWEMEGPRPDLTALSNGQQSSARRRSGQAGTSYTGQRMLERFRSMFEDLKSTALGPEEERAMITLLFESMQQIHEAGRRHSRGDEAG